MTAFFCSRSALTSSRPRVLVDRREDLADLDAGQPRHHLREPGHGEVRGRLEPLGAADGPEELQPLGLVGPPHFDLDGLRRPHDPRAHVGEVLGDQDEGDVGGEQRRIGRPFLDVDAHGAVVGGRLARRLGHQRLGIGQQHGHAERRLPVHGLLQERVEQGAERHRLARQRLGEAGAVHAVDDRDGVGEVAVGFAGQERGAVGALVLDHHFALAEDPLGQEAGQRHEVGGAVGPGRGRAPAPDRACCRGGRTCCPAAPGCRGPACGPSRGSSRRRRSPALHLLPRAAGVARLGRNRRHRRRRRQLALPRRCRCGAAPPSRARHGWSLSDWRTIVSSSSAMACGSRSDIEFWCSTSTSDSIESISVCSARTVSSTWANDASRRRLSSRFLRSAAAPARSGRARPAPPRGRRSRVSIARAARRAGVAGSAAARSAGCRQPARIMSSLPRCSDRYACEMPDRPW